MTPMQTAPVAEHQKIWNGGLRMSEVLQIPSNAARPPQGLPYTDILRTVGRSLRAGWKWIEGKRTQQLASRRLRLAETISLGEKRSVSIVQVDSSQYLIGCSSGSVQLLAVLDKKEDTRPDGGTVRLADQGGAS